MSNLRPRHGVHAIGTAADSYVECNACLLKCSEGYHAQITFTKAAEDVSISDLFRGV